MPTFVQIFDPIGMFAFAIGGIRLASARRFDWFGAYAVESVTTIGGGTMHNLLLDAIPSWMADLIYLICTGLALLWAISFKKYLIHPYSTLFIFDTVGLALFTVVGVGKSLSLGHPFWVAAIMDSTIGAAGGMIHDVFINEISLISRKEICTTVCVVNGTAYWIYESAGMHFYGCQVIDGVSAFITRIPTVKHKVCLPILPGNDGEEEGKES